MKAVILAGGFGTRLQEESQYRPKPMVEIGDKPILWHIMKIYESHGITDFIVCIGYKGYFIKEYFHNYFLHNSDVTIDIKNNRMEVHRPANDAWRVSLIDTGLETMTGGRLRRIRPYLEDETFFVTYGDGVGNVDIAATLDFHRKHGGAATVTAVSPAARFGALHIEDGQVTTFREKPESEGGLINGGFFVLEPRALDNCESDATIWEREPLQRLAESGDLFAFEHDGFWQPMDTLRDLTYLRSLWDDGKAPWKSWE